MTVEFEDTHDFEQAIAEAIGFTDRGVMEIAILVRADTPSTVSVIFAPTPEELAAIERAVTKFSEGYDVMVGQAPIRLGSPVMPSRPANIERLVYEVTDDR